jgi:hypothetical protein
VASSEQVIYNENNVQRDRYVPSKARAAKVERDERNVSEHERDRNNAESLASIKEPQWQSDNGWPEDDY